jgi:hypothetical protein
VYPTNSLSLGEGRRVLALCLVLLGLDIQGGRPLLALLTNVNRSAGSWSDGGCWLGGWMVQLWFSQPWLPSSISSIPLNN